MRRLLCFLTLLAPLARPAEASSSQVYGGALQALPLYGRLATAREAALGDAFHAAARGEDALFANPAGLSDLGGSELGLHHQSWIGGIDEEALAGSWSLGPGLGLAAFGVMVNYGSFDLRDAQGIKVGDAVVQDYGLGLGLGLRSAFGLSGGIALRGLRQDLVTDAVYGLGVDTGLSWAGPQGWTAGLDLLALRMMDGSAAGNGLRCALTRRWDASPGWVWPALALNWEANGLARLQAGLDLRLNPALDLRAGYEQRLGETLVAGLQGLTLGLGFKLGSLAFDYAYLPQGDLGGGHRASVAWRPWQSVAEPTETPNPIPSPSPTQTPSPLPPPTLPLALPDLDRLLPSLGAPSPTPPSATPTPNPAADFKEDPLAWARRLEDQGRLGEALAEYERLCIHHPEQVGAWRGAADLAYQLKLKAKALAAFHQVLRLAPDPDLEAWLKDYEQDETPP